MRVAVYTICKNEEKFVERWAQSTIDADVRIIADTGSTDQTVQKARDAGITVVYAHVHPFRFDDARNAALAAIPLDVDYCISLDMDETLSPGWREELRKAYDNSANRVMHTLATNFIDNDPSMKLTVSRIHSRSGWRWKYPAHEALYPYGIVENTVHSDITIEHHPDETKTRGQYLELLEIAVQEGPTDSRPLYYLGREYIYRNRNIDAVKTFNRYLEVSQWPAERCSAYRFMATCDVEQTETLLLKAIDQHPCRESLLDLAKFFKDKDWNQCFRLASRAILIQDKPTEWHWETWAWGAEPYDLAALSSHFLGEHKNAIEYGLMALELEPENKRLKTNLNYYREKMNGNI